MDRISFALLAIGEKDDLLGYITCRESDKFSLYFQYGGAFPGTIKTSMSFKAYQECINFCRPKYKRITTMIENTNTSMLKMAMKVGFRIQGINYFDGHIFVEHALDL